MLLIVSAATRGYGAFTNSIGMAFAEISPIVRNSKPIEARPGSNKQHLVTPFWIGTTEVTQKQWKSIMGENPSNHKGDNLPVEMVSWNSAVAFCKKLSEREGRVYRLPTELEWCFACDGGNELGKNELQGYAWTLENATNTMPVGVLRPNRYGLFDMHGNVAEWCSDAGSLKNPLKNDKQYTYRVVKGGAVGYFPKDCVVSARMLYLSRPGEYRNGIVGFRVVCEQIESH